MSAPRAADPNQGAWVMDLGRGVGTVLRDHAALLFLLLTMLGASYEFFLHLEFGVNILQFADPLDFLFAAIRQPLVVVFTVLPVALLWLLVRFDRWLRARSKLFDRFSARQESWDLYPAMRRVINGAFVLIYFTLFTLRYADFVAQRLRAGHGRQVIVELARDGVERRPLRGTLVGTTSKFVMLYVPGDSLARVLPVEGISQMIMLRRRRGVESAPVPADSVARPVPRGSAITPAEPMPRHRAAGAPAHDGNAPRVL